MTPGCFTMCAHHVTPGSKSRYSSGGYWRLSQALTAIWKKDLKDVLDERIMSTIGIPANRWDWLTGEQVRNDIDFYPDMPGYGKYLDAPYRIDGMLVRGGPGWVVMRAEDFARVGLLIATGRSVPIPFAPGGRSPAQVFRRDSPLE